MSVKPRVLGWSASPIFLMSLRSRVDAPSLHSSTRLAALRDVRGYLDYWGNRLETSVADPKFKELKEYAKRMSSLEDEEKAEVVAED